MGNDITRPSSPLENRLQEERNEILRWRDGAGAPSAAPGLGVAGDSASVRPVAPPETVQGDSAQSSRQDIVACLDCAEIAEFVTFSDPPIAKCFRCALLMAMNRMCALCGRHPVECIVRAVGENERQDVIGICANCFSKRLSGMRN